jgi:RF-1 domain
MADKEILFSVTKKDFRIETFRCPGHGGQNVNKVNSGVRITHEPSGVSVRCCDERDQLKNKKLAFKRLTEHKAFQAWLKVEAARKTGELERAERAIEESLKRIKVESKNMKGQWIEGLTQCDHPQESLHYGLPHVVCKVCDMKWDAEPCGNYGCTKPRLKSSAFCPDCYEDYKEDPEAYK